MSTKQKTQAEIVKDWKAKGVIGGKRWNTANDPIVRKCEICWPLNGMEAKIDEPFVHPVTGEKYDHPPAHDGCRCCLTPIMDMDLVSKQFWDILNKD
jgi:uncharacterized protein with gpF-like domain